jgi:UDP-N-acetylglucosamine--N-acetylmuramyl-(pentapeptide) pyrophosphoryl-undecaprenol N-acetylglucosamine transferase
VRVFFTGGGTGGHLYPALAIARALVRRMPEARPHFLGATRGIEREILPTTEFPHTLLELHPLYRAAPWRNWRTLTSLVRGVRQVERIAQGDPPRLVVATGGYASTASLAWSVQHRVPFVIQDQNAFPGRTVALFSRWATEMYMGFPESAARLPRVARARAVDTGNPIDPPPAARPSRAAARERWGFPPDIRFVVLAFGGSQGSAALNGLVDSWVSAGVPPGTGLIWSTGRAHFDRFAARSAPQVMVRPYLAPIAEAYAAADVAIARAGAMTTAELCAWGIPMLLLPLPTAAADHQTANARVLATAGAAEWVAERDATAASLDRFVRDMSGDPAACAAAAQAARARGRPEASAVIAERLMALLHARGAAS